MIGNEWDQILKDEFEKEYFKTLIKKIQNEYQKNTIYPKESEVFNAFRYTSYENTKVVILGQDPYHGASQAEGLSFSVKKGIKRPPSLDNIFKELKADLDIDPPNHGSLIEWANQGVLLLNAVLTVKENTPASHQGIGWEIFTDEVIKKLNEKKTPIVFILWGNFAQKKASLIISPIHYIVASPHPSPFSAYNGFFGSKPFSKTNKFLKEHNIKEINWQIKN